MLGEVAHPGKQPHWQNAKVSAVREELPAGTAFQAALGVLAGCSIQNNPSLRCGIALDDCALSWGKCKQPQRYLLG